jgi:hypothetical protein
LVVGFDLSAAMPDWQSGKGSRMASFVVKKVLA